MPSTSRRGRILENLIAQLQTITTANGYSQNVAEVTMDVRTWGEKPAAECPVIYIVDESTTLNYKPTKTLEMEWQVALFAYMRDQSQIQMEEFVSDIVQCIFKNVTLADTLGNKSVSHVRVRNIVTDNQLFSQIEGSQLFKITLDLLYMTCVDQR